MRNFFIDFDFIDTNILINSHLHDKYYNYMTFFSTYFDNFQLILHLFLKNWNLFVDTEHVCIFKSWLLLLKLILKICIVSVVRVRLQCECSDTAVWWDCSVSVLILQYQHSETAVLWDCSVVRLQCECCLCGEIAV